MEAVIAEQAKNLAKVKTETDEKLGETALKLIQGLSEIESKLNDTDAKMGKLLNEKASESSQKVSEIESKLRKDLQDGIENLRGIIAKNAVDLSEFRNKTASDINQLKKDMLTAAEFHDFTKKFTEDLDLGEMGGTGLPEELPHMEGTDKPSSKNSKRKSDREPT
jgi:uncharacterized phage infection (PIP) family protein YhgE